MKKTIYKIELKTIALKNNINANISKLKRGRGLISKNFGNKVFNNLAIKNTVTIEITKSSSELCILLISILGFFTKLYSLLCVCEKSFVSSAIGLLFFIFIPL